jgi:DNA-binding transcriptional MerR regulator
MFRINEVSQQVNLSQKRIREYEKEGFINPDRELRTNNRLYSDFEVTQIKRINFLIHERGFTLACLRAVLNLAPCWTIFDCRHKEECSAFQHPHESCYDVREKYGALCPGPCDKCAIYINRNQPREPILEKDYH